MNYSKTDTNQIRALRAYRRMSQTELAALTGMGQWAISEIERGRMNPTDDEFARIKAALNWPPNAEEAFEILEGVK